MIRQTPSSRVQWLVLLAVASGLLAACSPRTPKSLEAITAQVLASPAGQAIQGKAGHSLQHARSVENAALQTEQFTHYIEGIEVAGSGVAYHATSEGSELIRDHLVPISLNPNPSLTSEQAASEALAQVPGSTLKAAPVLKFLPPTRNVPARLTYFIELSSAHEVILDAHSGDLIAILSNEDAVQAPDIQVRSAQGQGSVVTLNFSEPSESGEGGDELRSCDLFPLGFPEKQEHIDVKECRARVANSCQALAPTDGLMSIHPEKCELVSGDAWRSDPSAVRARENAGRFTEYFATTHSRAGFDGQGSPIISVVHAGIRMANASWHRQGRFLVYGDGDGRTTGDHTLALDVAGHELTHGVIATTAALLSMGESGALNESLADFFGKMIENRGDWNLGRSLFLTPGASAIRDLQTPSRITGSFVDADDQLIEKPLPSRRSEMAPINEPCTSDNDSCAVHYNATIPGHAWFLIHERLGRAKAEKLLYLTLTQFLSSVSTFDSAARDLLSACTQTLSKTDCKEVRRSLQETQLLSAESDS